MRPLPRPLPPGGLLARIALVLLCALVFEFSGAWAINAWQRRHLVSSEQLRLMASHLLLAEEIAADSKPSERQRLMRDLGGSYLQLDWAPTTPLPAFVPGETQLKTTRQTLTDAAPDLQWRDLRLRMHTRADGRREMLGAIGLPDATFVTFRAQPLFATAPPVAMLLSLNLALVIATMAVAVASTRAILRPLRNLAATADATGGATAPGFAVEGPREVQQLAVALGAMQARLLRAVEDHTESLVAVSHDLRTPIQRLRLRATLVADDELRDALSADLQDIERFINSVIGYMSRGEIEERRLVDVAALAMTAADDAADAGAAVDYLGPDALAVVTRPLSLKRALANLVENACKHADAIVIRLSHEGDELVLSVEDDGPGIPPERREEAFLPFHRLDGGRSRPGAGLGLSIVQSAVGDLDGRISLGVSPLGGLAAEIRIPALRLSVAAGRPEGRATGSLPA
jgi:signal transduction histidine kinase